MKQVWTYFVGAILFVAIIALILTVGATAWKFVFWPLFFEQWLGPIPWRGAFGVAFVLIALSQRPKGTS